MDKKCKIVNVTENFKLGESRNMVFLVKTTKQCVFYVLEQWYAEDRRDEVHFWLNGYVNKQNCRIWSEANPQVYVETPLHPEKLTVWCALWAGGPLLEKR
ncbi:hypothetical protein TNCV_3150901 [Trichonephila clavipes]|nr:hypothetical protein TNCV_3150901 [Trichonephila clavipes]